MATYIVNEVLCVLRNNFGKMTRADLSSLFADFYSENEIAAAKQVLCDVAENCLPKLDELKKIKSRVGDGKLRRDIDDIMSLYSALDVKKAVLPLSLAADTSRIPAVHDVDLNKLTSSISSKVGEINASVSAQIQQLSVTLNAFISTKVDELLSSVSLQLDDGNSSLSARVDDLKTLVTGESADIKTLVCAQSDDVKSSVRNDINVAQTVITKQADDVQASVMLCLRAHLSHTQLSARPDS